MIYVEDFLEHLSDLFIANDKLRVSDWDRNFTIDVAAHTRAPDPNALHFQVRRQLSPGLTTSQANVVLKLLARHRGLIDKSYQQTLTDLLAKPSYRIPLTTSAEIKREVRWIGGSKILFRFKFNSTIADELKSREIPHELAIFSGVNYNTDFKVWGVSVDNSNVEYIMKFIQRHEFEFDDEILQFFMTISNNIGKPNLIQVESDGFNIEVNNDILASEWLDEMEWLFDV